MSAIDATDSLSPPRDRRRWIVCGLLFAATAICYMDRQIFGLLKPTLMRDIGWTETDYGDIVAVFSLFYAFGYLLAGRGLDIVGVRRGLPIAVTGWSMAAATHGLAGGVFGFQVARGALGLMEGANFPAAIKAIREWFPPSERALATGIFNAGSSIGAVLTPIALPFVVVAMGWRAAFLLSGALGLFWLVAWLLLYRRPPHRARPDAAVAWLPLLTKRGTLAYAGGMLMTSPVWWFYLNWVPGFLHDRFGTDMMAAIGPLVAIYLIADLGSIGGGWLSSRLIGQGMAPVRARIAAMLAMTALVLPVAVVPACQSMWPAVLLIALAAAAHQGFSANLYTLVSDTMPGGATSSVVGIGGFAAGIAGMFVALAVGRVLDATGGNYMILFLGAAAAYPLATLFIAALVGRAPVSTESIA